MNMFDYLLNNFQCKTAANNLKNENSNSESAKDSMAKQLGAGIGSLAGITANKLSGFSAKVRRAEASGYPFLTPEELRDATSRFERAAKGNGYTESIPGNTNRVFRNPKTGKVIGLSSVSAKSAGPHLTHLDMMPQNIGRRVSTELEFAFHKELPDKLVYLNHSKNLRDDAIIAHEVGHSLQGKKFINAAIQARKVPILATNGLLVNTLLSNGFRTKTEKDLKNERTRDRVLAGLGTAGGGVTLANELHASYAGSKYLGSWKNRIKAFRGIPSYVTFAAVPGLTYAGKYVAAPYLKEKYNQFVSKKK